MEHTFTIRLAGLPLGVTCLYESTREYCREYLSQEAPELWVKTTPEGIQAEQEFSDRENALEGLPAVQYPPEQLEPLALYRQIVGALLPYDIVLMHGSVIAVDGQAYLFTAKSGTGKSTHTRLWRRQFGSRSVMINDDKPLLRFTENGVMACGTPWNGKHRLGTNTSAPLKAICILQRGEENRIEAVSASANWPMLLQQLYRPQEREAMSKTLELLRQLMSRVPLYRLQCNMNPEAAAVAYYGMNGDTL